MRNEVRVRHCKARALAPLLLALLDKPAAVRSTRRRDNSSRNNYKERDMMEQWKQVCRIKDVPQRGVRVVQRGLAWQELPGVELMRDDLDRIYAVLEGGAKRFAVKVEDNGVYLDLNELKAPASRAEAALAGAFAVASPPIC